ncbi:hypothetical protein CALCODRAFT_365835 [Calocera cornea HHB12733]|uniref:Uncharacterized protein n=1 Tax=Calocera cornea HHB12733 TaxID=1353952 RepID=A0A165J9V4_9BASI|nr:hypothetical protein CALCODRAFT_365835 [Calocera cornea HHB12733]
MHLLQGLIPFKPRLPFSTVPTLLCTVSLACLSCLPSSIAWYLRPRYIVLSFRHTLLTLCYQPPAGRCRTFAYRLNNAFPPRPGAFGCQRLFEPCIWVQSLHMFVNHEHGLLRWLYPIFRCWHTGSGFRRFRNRGSASKSRVFLPWSYLNTSYSSSLAYAQLI